MENLKSEYLFVEHPFEPIFNINSKVLILGSIPSAKSRETNFYYGHPKNRFWNVISYITNTFPIPESIELKKEMLIKNNIALWDVIKSCEISGSSDSSIRNVTVNNINSLLKISKINNLYANGSLAYKLFMKFYYNKTNINIIKLPSTSPANAVYKLEDLICKWRIINYHIL